MPYEPRFVITAYPPGKQARATRGRVGREYVSGNLLVDLNSRSIRMPVCIVHAGTDEHSVGFYKHQRAGVYAAAGAMMRCGHYV